MYRCSEKRLASIGYTLLIFTPQYSALPVALRPVPLPAAAPRSPGGRWPVALAGLGGGGAGGASQLSPSPRYGRCGHSPQTPRPSRERAPASALCALCTHNGVCSIFSQSSSPSATTLFGSGSLSPVRGAGNVRLIRGAAEHVHVEANGRECEKRCASRQNRPHARQPWSARVWGEKARGPGERGGFGT